MDDYKQLQKISLFDVTIFCEIGEKYNSKLVILKWRLGNMS